MTYNTNIRLFAQNPPIKDHFQIVDKSRCTDLSIIQRFHCTPLTSIIISKWIQLRCTIYLVPLKWILASTHGWMPVSGSGYCVYSCDIYISLIEMVIICKSCIYCYRKVAVSLLIKRILVQNEGSMESMEPHRFL